MADFSVVYSCFSSFPGEKSLPCRFPEVSEKLAWNPNLDFFPAGKTVDLILESDAILSPTGRSRGGFADRDGRGSTAKNAAVFKPEAELGELKGTPSDTGLGRHRWEIGF